MQKMQIMSLAIQSGIETPGKSATACTSGDKFHFCGDPSWASLKQLQVLLSVAPWHKVAVAYNAIGKSAIARRQAHRQVPFGTPPLWQLDIVLEIPCRSHLICTRLVLGIGRINLSVGAQFSGAAEDFLEERLP